MNWEDEKGKIGVCGERNRKLNKGGDRGAQGGKIQKKSDQSKGVKHYSEGVLLQGI